MLVVPETSDMQTAELLEFNRVRSSARFDPDVIPRPLWPKLHPAALSGIAGEFTLEAAERSGTDPAALLISFLTCAAAAVGGKSSLQVGITSHPARLFSVLVSSSYTCPAVAFQYALQVFSAADAGNEKARKFPPLAIKQWSLTTGEDFVEAVTDSAAEQDVLQGPVAVADKSSSRLLLVVNGFGKTMQAVTRSNSPLEPMLKAAWDDSDLQLITRSRKRIKASGNVCLLGRIGLDDIAELITKENRWHDLGSRLLWVAVPPKRLAASPKPLDQKLLLRWARQLTSAISVAEKTPVLALSQEAETRWEEFYEQLSRAATGAIAPASARSPALVLRLAAIFALLERRPLVTPTDLGSAMAVWCYCQASARLLFSGSTTNNSMRVLLALADGPKTQTEMHHLFSRHIKGVQLNHILIDLEARGLVVCKRTDGGSAKGRPSTTWSLGPGTTLDTLLEGELP